VRCAVGAPDIDPARVLAAAHEVALGLDATRIARIGQSVSLFDVPAGGSDLGEIVEAMTRRAVTRLLVSTRGSA
jgi:hypothetical protein